MGPQSHWPPDWRLQARMATRFGGIGIGVLIFLFMSENFSLKMTAVGGSIGLGLAAINIIGQSGRNGLAMIAAALFMLLLAFFTLQFDGAGTDLFSVSTWNILAAALASDGIILFVYNRFIRKYLRVLS